MGKSTSEVLLANLDDTYEFIEKMIDAASSPFRSKRIHIGMDEVIFFSYQKGKALTLKV
jgi:N-acetyl-beta-hexosaminidase